MKLLVVGATGGVGQHVVDQALAAGHTVHAFARSSLDRSHDELRVFTGDATRPGALDDALAGVDAVICAIGGGLSDRTTRTEATRALVAAMPPAEVKRLVVVSSLGAGDSYRRVGFATKAIVKTLLRNAIHDHDGQEGAVRGSATEWTILRPGGLSDEPLGDSRVVVGSEGSLSGRGRVSRATVAQRALQALDEPSWRGQAVAVLAT